MQHRNVTDALRALTDGSETGVLLTPFSVAYNLPAPRLDMLIETLSLRRVQQSAQERVFCEKRWQELLSHIEEIIVQFHRSNPALVGASIKDIHRHC